MNYIISFTLLKKSVVNKNQYPENLSRSIKKDDAIKYKTIC